jgi:hypothetical protein
MKNFEGFITHAEGLRRIVALRGGIDNLGWNGYMKSRVLQYGFCILLAVSAVNVIGVRIEAGLLARQQRLQQRLTYPRHPFSRRLGQKISKLPTGFHNMARAGMLSLSVIDFLEQLGSHLQENTSTKVVSSRTAAYLMLLDIPELSAIERWIASTLLSFCVAIDRILRGTDFGNPMHILRVDAQVTQLVKEGHNTSCDPDFLAWAAFVLYATTEPETGCRQWADQFIGSVTRKETREKELEALFWPIPRVTS